MSSHGLIFLKSTIRVSLGLNTEVVEELLLVEGYKLVLEGLKECFFLDMFLPLLIVSQLPLAITS